MKMNEGTGISCTHLLTVMSKNVWMTCPHVHYTINYENDKEALEDIKAITHENNIG
ncbi:hypothetical protein [Sutcliffiella sp. NC1]|uniref:hypothetical protein n=1 Tax=Sutcliffiella sp. NC1 TaxID=3004096 RepID=UPI0022DCF72C|nr:hypothetical protein [Sutcliffiella sp. NC1]WBL16865.1 hypothetical protein O1A01_09610 [Sutcliffiella sp. NC1]